MRHPSLTVLSHGQPEVQRKRKGEVFLFLTQNHYWRSCPTFFTVLRPGWTPPWAWTWMWKWRQHILHPTEGLWHWLQVLPLKLCPVPWAASEPGPELLSWNACLGHHRHVGATAWFFSFYHTDKHPFPAFSAGTGWSSAVPKAPRSINSPLLKLPEQIWIVSWKEPFLYPRCQILAQIWKPPLLS